MNSHTKTLSTQGYSKGQHDLSSKSTAVSIEDKMFFIEERQNEHGEFVRLIETNKHHSRYNLLVVPRKGAAEFARAILATLGAVDNPATTRTS